MGAVELRVFVEGVPLGLALLLQLFFLHFKSFLAFELLRSGFFFLGLAFRGSFPTLRVFGIMLSLLFLSELLLANLRVLDADAAHFDLIAVHVLAWVVLQETNGRAG